MAKIIAETHCHTCACDHAYSTLLENVREAARKQIPFLCVTEHGPKMVDGPHEGYFGNIVRVVPEVLEGVVVLKGAEANILDYEGSLDVPERYLKKLDWVIASYHTVCIQPATPEEHTNGWIAVAKNPLVDVIGHCGDQRFAFDMEKAVRAFAEYGKIVEINAHSFTARPGSAENCLEIAKLCKKYRVPVVCSSDAHFCTGIGEVGESLALLEQVDFPEELILNIDYDRFLRVAREKSGKKLVEER